MLKLNSKLRELRLESNKIGDVGALQIANAVEVNRFLNELCLLDNCISKDGVKHFTKALKNNSTLTCLSITAMVRSSTPIDDELRDLRASHEVGCAAKWPQHFALCWFVL